MPKFLVTKTFQYTEEVEVEAETGEDAKVVAEGVDGTRIHDDTHMDSVARRLAD